MSATDRTNALDAQAPAPSAPAPVDAPIAAGRSAPRLLARAPALDVLPRYAALSAILALSAVLNTHRLAQNGYANTFYSAGVQSMLKSWHNFFFVSFDPGGLVTIDKPPLGVWVQAASAHLFGLSPLSLLLPEAIISTLAVAALYRAIARRLGAAAGLAAALALAVFPSFVAVSRDNGVDPLLILLMILACGAALNAIEDGRWRWLLACAVLVGLAFNTKTLAAYLIVPGIAFAYLLCAPGSWGRRATMLLVAGIAMALCSFAWIAAVELTPAAQRPYVGSSTNNTELGLTFSYNGFGRVEGEQGGPGDVHALPGAMVPAAPHHSSPLHPTAASILRAARLSPTLPDGRLRNPLSFGGATGPLRLFESRLADQGSWILPFALLGLLAFALLLAQPPAVCPPGMPLGARSRGRAPVDGGEGPDGEGHPGPGMLDGGRTVEGHTGDPGRRRRDPRLATLIVFGGWLLAEVAILSFSKGIVHPYYISALAPGAAAMLGAGAVAFAGFARERDWRVLLLPCAVAATLAAQLAIVGYQHYLHRLVPFLVAGAVVALCAMAVRRLAGPAMALLVCVLLVAPAAYARTTWLARVQGTFPAAGPHQATGSGEYGSNEKSMRIYRNLIHYVSTHRPGTRWAVLTVAAPTAAPIMLLGLPAGALAGYSGTDPVLDGPGLARFLARGEARYVALGGAYASRGGNLATKAVLRACPQVPAAAWHGPRPSPYELVLFDCRGRERALSGAAAGRRAARDRSSQTRLRRRGTQPSRASGRARVG
jgi:4-amino-4-deoxy-L-arabinose transferase-like glycosyltransferase